MAKSKTLYEMLDEAPRIVLRRNHGALGIYMIGVKQERVIYGYDRSDAVVALRRLQEKGYKGVAFPFEARSPDEINIFACRER